MSTLDCFRALSVGIAVVLGTLLLSIPLVAMYAHLIDPGHPPEVYHAAARWIAPWSSHIGGPMLFFWLNRRGALRYPQRNAVAFAWATIASYVVVDLVSVPLFGLTLSAVVTMTFSVSDGQGRGSACRGDARLSRGRDGADARGCSELKGRAEDATDHGECRRLPGHHR